MSKLLRMQRRVVVLALMGCLGLFPAAAWSDAARQTTTGAPNTFGETVEVKVVNVEAVVTDRDGNRVPGLAADDFTLTVDGRPVPIRYFSEIRGGDAIAPAAAGARADWSAVPGVVPGQPVGTSYLVFLDDYFSLRLDRDRALERLREELPALGPEDRMAIVAYDGDRVDLLSSWSQSTQELDSVLQKATSRPADGFQRWAERRSYDLDRRLPASFRFRRSAFDLTPEESFYARLVSDQVERVTLAAASTARGFAAPPGRKVMLVLSGGWPFDPVRFAIDNPRRVAMTEPGVEAGAELYRPLTDTVNLLGYTLYTVDVAGNQATGFDGSLLRSTELDSPRTLSYEREQELHASLDFLARETGGKALLNARSEEPLAAAVDDTRSYYWIGFVPDRQGDDRSHRIELQVSEPGLEVRSRRDFFDYSQSRELSLAVESALLFGSPLGSQSLEVRLGEPVERARGRMVLPLTVTVPVDAVTFLPESGSYTARLELRIAAIDENGGSSDVPVIPVTLTSRTEPAKGTTLTYTTDLLMRRRAQDMVAVLYDPVSGALLSSALQISPPPASS
jgi:VWFA-related protein